MFNPPFSLRNVRALAGAQRIGASKKIGVLKASAACGPGSAKDDRNRGI